MSRILASRLAGVGGVKEAGRWILGFRSSQWRSLRYTHSLSLPDQLIQKEINKFDPTVPVDSAITPPATWYTMTEFHHIECRSVFHDNWVAVGRVEQVSKPGQYITGFLAEEPYILTRDKSGELKAFYNVCRHHATLVMDEACGTADQFQCPYHGWTYDLDGRLIKATRLKDIKNFKARDFGLKPIHIQTWGPMIFISLADNASDLHNWLKPLHNQLDKWGFEKGLRFIEHRRYKLACNWKIFIDNYLDGGYHVDYVHKDLSALLDSRSYQTTTFDGFSIQSSAGSKQKEHLMKDDLEKQRITDHVLYAHIFPNLMINRYGPWLDVNYCFPVDYENCVVAFDWFLEQSFIDTMSKSELDIYVKDSIKASDQVQQEDIWLCERVQKGMQSSSFTHGRYAPRLEHADHDFHVKLASKYQQWLSKKTNDHIL